MGSIARYIPPPEPISHDSLALTGAVPRLRGRISSLWDGEYDDLSTDFVAPDWESLPAEVRWKVSGRDVAPGPILGSFALEPVVVRRDAAYREVTSGWLLHESGVFLVDASRPLKPARGKAYRPAGEWTVEFECVVGSGFRLKRGSFPPETSDDYGDETGVPPRFTSIWRSIPRKPRVLLASAARAPGASTDHGYWWVRGGAHEVHMTLCYQRRSTGATTAVFQTRTTRISRGADGPTTSNQLNLAPWDVCVFSATLGTVTGRELSGSTVSLPVSSGR